MRSLVLSFGVIFLAELGDKSQLMALAFAARHRFRTVLAGITLATLVVHLVSVALGNAVGAAVPAPVLSALAGAAFLAFAWWTLRGDELSQVSHAGSRCALLAVALAFLLAELGDKTMLATVTLATTHDWLGTWIGSTLGMVAADALAIVAGAALARRLPEGVVRSGAATLFAAFGAVLLADALR